MTLTVSKVFHFAAGVVFVMAATAAGLTLNVTTLALVALALWQFAEATK